MNNSRRIARFTSRCQAGFTVLFEVDNRLMMGVWVYSTPLAVCIVEAPRTLAVAVPAGRASRCFRAKI